MAIIVLSALLALSAAINLYFVVYLAILFRIFENPKVIDDPVMRAGMREKFHKAGTTGGNNALD